MGKGKGRGKGKGGAHGNDMRKEAAEAQQSDNAEASSSQADNGGATSSQGAMLEAFQSLSIRSVVVAGEALTEWRRAKAKDNNYKDPGLKKKDDNNHEDPSLKAWNGSKLLTKKEMDSIHADEDRSLVQPIEWKNTKVLDEKAKLEGKCLYRPKLVEGHENNRVTLWANYFPIKFTPATLAGMGKFYKYDVTFERDKQDTTLDTSSPETGKGKQPDDGSTGQQSKTDKKTEVPPRLAKILLLKVLGNIVDIPEYVTDFKKSIIFLKEVDFSVLGAQVHFDPSTGITRVHIHHPPPGAPNSKRSYHIFFGNEKTFDMASDEKTMREGKGAASAQAAARLRDMVSMVVGYILRNDSKIAAVGSNRFFKQDSSQRVHVDSYSMLAILRGFCHNVRPATNRLLVNVNVTASVFRPRINIGRWIRIWAHERNWDKNENKSLKAQDLALLHKILSKIKVLYKAPAPPKLASDSNSPTYSDASGFPLSSVPNGGEEFFIAGLARNSDGCICTCEKEGTCCKCQKSNAASECDKNCRDKKSTRGIRIDADFATASQASFKCDIPTCKIKKESALHKVGDCLETDHVAYKFKYDNMPLINRGTPAKPNYVPAERCWIVFGQPLKTKLDEEKCEPLMINFACRRPYQNAEAICKEGYQALRLDSNSSLKQLGITIGKDLVTVEGRVLTAPMLSYRKKEPKSVSNGAWNIANDQIHTPCPSSTKWAYIVMDDNRHKPLAIDAGVKAFETQLKGRGILSDTIGGNTQALPPFKATTGANITLGKGNRAQTLLELSQMMSRLKQRVNLVLIIFPSAQPSDFYNKIKFLADVVHGIHTCCVISEKFYKSKKKEGVYVWEASPDYFANVALKFNLKLGGKNHELSTGPQSSLPDIGETMVVGYDVIHPTGPETQDMQSHVGFVSSTDVKFLSQWRGYHWQQEARQEILDSKLANAFRIGLESWGSKTAFPQNIVIFRDGVSESQYETVLNKELSLILKGCDEFRKNRKADKLKGPRGLNSEKWSPKITLVVSVKRHSTRFYPTDDKSRNSDSGNIKAGTVVDRSVTQARYWEFFLTAQDAIKGTARPTRYVVLHDEIFRPKYSGTAATRLEDYTHKLCYMFGRATKAVRLCTPAYYADILCTRARAYESVLKDSDFIHRIHGSAEERERIGRAEIHENIKGSMFWI